MSLKLGKAKDVNQNTVDAIKTELGAIVRRPLLVITSDKPIRIEVELVGKLAQLDSRIVALDRRDDLSPEQSEQLESLRKGCETAKDEYFNEYSKQVRAWVGNLVRDKGTRAYFKGATISVNTDRKELAITITRKNVETLSLDDLVDMADLIEMPDSVDASTGEQVS